MTFSVLIISHGREELLLKCLDSLRPPVSEWQLILVGNGLPLSEVILAKAQSLGCQIDVLNLPEISTPGTARNQGLALVKQEWVYLLDDDAYLPGTYFGLILPLLDKQGLDVIGGPDSPAKDMEPFSEALAIALSSPFCTGATYARHKVVGSKLVLADEESLTSCNLWIRSKLLAEVRFPEDYRRTEEIALLTDLKAKGARMYHHPKLWVYHHRRKKLKDLWSPTFNAGFYRSKLMQEKPASDKAMFWLPSVFVLLHLTLLLDVYSFITLARIYGTLVVAISLALCARRQKVGLLIYVSFLHWLIVFNFGLGFMAQRLGYPWSSPKS